MATRTSEGDALQEMTATLNEGISEQGTPSTFGDAMSSANFVSPQNAISRGGDSDYTKVGNITSAVKSHISTQSTQEKVTRRFKRHDLRLGNLTQLLVERLRKNACFNGINLHVTAPFGNGDKLEPI